jgi:dihydrofolate reductase
MRRLTSFLFISLDGIVESPNRFVRDDVFDDLISLIGETISEQDAVLLGRSMYEEWSQYWPSSTIEPFATFINNTSKFVVSKTLKALEWRPSAILSGDLKDEIASLKDQMGKTIGVHGSISLVQSLLSAGLLDEMRFVLFPAIVGQGRRLLSRDGDPIQLSLQSARTTPSGLQYITYTPR